MIESAYRLRELRHANEMAETYPLVRQLNPALTREAYAAMLPEMIANGYHQVSVFRDDQCVGVAGLWVNTKLYCGRYLELDNVVIDVAHRSAGLGKRLVDWAVQHAQDLGCQMILLDVYVQNIDAQRFYIREGFTMLGHHMQRSLPAS